MHKVSKKIRIYISVLIGAIMSMPHIMTMDINTTAGLIYIPVLSWSVMHICEWILTYEMIDTNNKTDKKLNRLWIFCQASMSNPLALLIEKKFPNTHNSMIYACGVSIIASLLLLWMINKMLKVDEKEREDKENIEELSHRAAK